jgi:hypothetical protein
VTEVALPSHLFASVPRALIGTDGLNQPPQESTLSEEAVQQGRVVRNEAGSDNLIHEDVQQIVHVIVKEEVNADFQKVHFHRCFLNKSLFGFQQHQ